MRRCWNNFALDIKWDSALLPFLYLSFYHWKMMAVHHSTTQQWATTAVNHNTPLPPDSQSCALFTAEMGSL